MDRSRSLSWNPPGRQERIPTASEWGLWAMQAIGLGIGITLVVFGVDWIVQLAQKMLWVLLS